MFSLDVLSSSKLKLIIPQIIGIQPGEERAGRRWWGHKIKCRHRGVKTPKYGPGCNITHIRCHA